MYFELQFYEFYFISTSAELNCFLDRHIVFQFKITDWLTVCVKFTTFRQLES